MGGASSQQQKCKDLSEQNYDYYAVGKTPASPNFFQKLAVQCFVDNVNTVDFVVPDWLTGKVSCMGLSVQIDPWKVSFLVGVTLVASFLFFWLLTKISRRRKDPILDGL